MKWLAVLVVGSAVVVWAGYGTYPEECARYSDQAVKAVLRAWDNVEANPTPVLFALGTFVVTVLYHTARGKSLRESVEVAATRVTVVPAPLPPAPVPEPAVVARARARATRTQLIADHIGAQNRYRKLPEAVVKAEKDVCYTEQAVADAAKALGERRKAHQEAVARLEAIRKEKAAADAELTEMEAELKRLADVV